MLGPLLIQKGPSIQLENKVEVILDYKKNPLSIFDWSQNKMIDFITECREKTECNDEAMTVAVSRFFDLSAQVLFAYMGEEFVRKALNEAMASVKGLN